MPTWRTVLRYEDTGSKLGWSVTNYRNDATTMLLKAAMNAWNTKYLACCFIGVRVVDFRFSDVALWRDVGVESRAVITTKTGSKAVGLMPLAECALVKGIGDTTNLGTAYYHLHGMDVSMFSSDGSLDIANADVAALNAADDSWFQQYRKVAKHGGALPIVNPPQLWGATIISGPYVRRLGTPFTLPGQRAHK